MSQPDVNEEIYDYQVLANWSAVSNETDDIINLSRDLVFNDGHRLSITINRIHKLLDNTYNNIKFWNYLFSILFVISTIGNSTVLYLLIKRRLHCPTKMDTMLMHLGLADLMVTFLLMPLEIVWAYTVEWKSTDFACRAMSFFKVFGLYSSSFIVICISIDRYDAVLKPLKMNSRRRIMLAIAWICSVICSIPQPFLFHLEEHPAIKGYFQCVTFQSITSEMQELAYNIANMCALYVLPLICFIYCYGAIYIEIYQRSKIVIKDADRLRRSNDDVLRRAKQRTLKMSITIVIVFLICWTPYYIICMWYSIDKNSARTISPLKQKGLLTFSATNSCLNPIVYGAFNIRDRLNKHTSVKSFCKCFDSSKIFTNVNSKSTDNESRISTTINTAAMGKNLDDSGNLCEDEKATVTYIK